MRLNELIKDFRAPAFPGSYMISFEGIEGAGKSTQIVKIQEFLEKEGLRVLLLREPGGTAFGEKLRQAILNSQTPLHSVAELHLFASSRAQLLHEVTLKELAVPNTVIIYDRYLDSSLAYQGMARDLGFEKVLQVHQGFPLNLVPHRTYYLKIPHELSQQRQKIRNAPKDYFEKKGPDFYKKLVEGYGKCLELFPERIKVIDGTQSAEEVTRQIESSLRELLMSPLKDIQN